jgi:allantoicase
VNEITHSLPGTLGWSSAGHDTPNHSEWVCVDLGRAVRIDNIKLCPRDDQEAEGGGFPTDFKIQASDDLNNWTDLVTRTGYGHGQKVLGVQSFVSTSRRCRYVRVYATRLGKISSSPLEYRFQLAELEVYGKDN